MSCSSCSYDGNGAPKGCGNKGHCTSGSCNKMNTYDWLATRDIYDPLSYGIVEVSFKKGARKDFYWNPDYTDAITGDMVLVEGSSGGYDIGRVSLSGDLVRLQMKKKKVNEERVTHKIIRKANYRDHEKLEEVRSKEKKALVKARVIARTIGLDMKLGDVEYQGDGKKATFYYTAEGRIDFRELVRQYAREFRIKIEMRQIGSRQESARIGGLGACGRELCCSTWLSDFKSVTTAAARYQNIAINQTKLSGQCGRLKCCLNYELDSYIDALADFPKKADKLKTEKGRATLIKTDIFKGLMYYAYEGEYMRGPIVALDKERVKEILAMNAEGAKPSELVDARAQMLEVVEKEIEFADVTGEIELPNIKRKKRKGNRNRPSNRGKSQRSGRKPQGNKPKGEKKDSEGGNLKDGSRNKDEGQGEKKSRNPKSSRSSKRGPRRDNKGERKKDE